MGGGGPRLGTVVTDCVCFVASTRLGGLIFGGSVDGGEVVGVAVGVVDDGIEACRAGMLGSFGGGCTASAFTGTG